MRKPKLLSFWGEETNPFANASTCNNGGGYFQPSGGALWRTPNGKMVTVEIADTSCGDFGDRVDVGINDGVHFWCFCWGNMDYVDSDKKIHHIMDSCNGCLKTDVTSMVRDTYAAIQIAAYQL